MGKEGMKRLYAHCIHSLTISKTPYEEIFAGIDGYLDGTTGYGDYTLSLNDDPSGADVLTADYLG